MKRLITLYCLFAINLITFSQKKINANDYGKKFDGIHFGILKDDGFALVDTLGNIVSDKIKYKQYDQNLKSFTFYKGITFEYDDSSKLYRLINLDRKPITDYNFKSIKPFITDNTWAIDKNEDEIYIDYKGNIICKYSKKEIEKQLGRTGLASSMKVVGFGNKKVNMFYDGFKKYLDLKSNQIGFINTDNQFVIKPQYHKASNFSNGLVAVCKVSGIQLTWGYVDANNTIKIPFKFSNQPGDFHSKRAMFFSKKRKFGFIDDKGNIAIEAKYYEVTNFYKGFALVREAYNSNTKLIDFEGKVINSFGEDIEVKATKENLVSLVNENLTIASLKTNLKKRVLTKRNIIINSKSEVLSKRFDKITNLVNGKALAVDKIDKTTTQEGLINTKGEFIIEIVKSDF